MKYLNVLLLAGLAGGAWAQTQSQIDAAREQADRELQRQTAPAAAPIQRPTGLDTEALTSEAIEFPLAEGGCIVLERLALTENTVMDEWDLEVFEVPFLGRCITPELVAQVLARTTDHYLARGFITSRAYLTNQDLSGGVLTVAIAEGQVEQVVAKAVSDDAQPPHASNVFEPEASPALNIRDLEQAVDQLNAVPGFDAKLKIEPGTAPDTSRVVFENSGEAVIQGRISWDNSGSESTGKEGASVSLKRGNILGRNEVWSVSYRKSLNGESTQSSSRSLEVQFPDGYNTYSAGYREGDYNTLLTFPVTGTVIDSSGANESRFVQVERVINRGLTQKHSVSARLQRDSVEAAIGGVEIGVSTRTIDHVTFGGDSTLTFGNAVLNLKPEVSVGLSEVDNLPEGTNTPIDNPQAEFLRYKLSADWSKPLVMSGHNLTWSSKLVLQYAAESLYGSQQLVVGGQSSVRGSKDVSIVGDSGAYLQNSLSLIKPFELEGQTIRGEYTLGYDVGSVSSVRVGAYKGELSALVLTARWSLNEWSLNLLQGLPISISGDREKGAPSLTTTLSYDF